MTTEAPHRFGWQPDLPDARDRIYNHAYEAARLSLTTFPPSVDLRTGMPPVYDQGQLGSCTANAIAGAIEYEQRKQGLKLFAPSRMLIYYDERALEGTVNSDSGAQIRDGMKVVAGQGACPESVWPYDVSRFAKKPTATAYKAAALHKVTSYLSVQQSETAMKTCLASGYPVVVGFTVYQSFESAAVAASGDAPMPQPHESVLGGHAVLLCGYDDATGRWLLRNSWSAGWGKAGYFTLPYAYLTNSRLASDYWTIRTES